MLVACPRFSHGGGQLKCSRCLPKRLRKSSQAGDESRGPQVFSDEVPRPAEWPPSVCTGSATALFLSRLKRSRASCRDGKRSSLRGKCSGEENAATGYGDDACRKWAGGTVRWIRCSCFVLSSDRHCPLSRLENHCGFGLVEPPGQAGGATG